MIGIRKSLDYVFTQRELKILDDVMPESKRTEEDEKELGPEVGNVSLIPKVFRLIVDFKKVFNIFLSEMFKSVL